MFIIELSAFAHYTISVRVEYPRVQNKLSANIAVAVLPWLFSHTRDDSNSVLEVVKDTHVCEYFSDSCHYTRVCSRRISHTKNIEIIALWEAILTRHWPPHEGVWGCRVVKSVTEEAVMEMNEQITNL